MFKVSTFYHFVVLDKLLTRRQQLFEFCQQRGIVGTILLGHEGINSTIAGDAKAVDALIALLRSDEKMADLQVKSSYCDKQPFKRLKVRIRREIVSLKAPVDMSNARSGIDVDPKDWDALLADPEIVVIDTRNDYECEMGTFKGAVDPHTQSFHDFPDYIKKHLDPARNKKVAMFCTGGVRCEKASAYMHEQGFEEVYQLKGGILNYLEKIPQEQSSWEGECFIFDDRVSLKHDLTPGQYAVCFACRHPLSKQQCESSQYEVGVQCPHCATDKTDAMRTKLRQRHQSRLQAKASHNPTL